MKFINPTCRFSSDSEISIGEPSCRGKRRRRPRTTNVETIFPFTRVNKRTDFFECEFSIIFNYESTLIAGVPGGTKGREAV